MRPHIGLEITPSIRLTRPLGSGGMGSVWVGHHSGLNADVAVKFLSADLSTSEGAQHRFADEASTAAQIKSPHVVHIHDHGVFAEELPFIVMELLDGEDLAQRVQRLGPLDLASTTVLVLQLGHVLAKAHAAGIVHRDVKPENVVLLHGYGEIFLKLIDFGIAKRLGGDRALTANGSVVGTPDFMSPEQLLSAKDVGPQVDAWSLAAVAYFALVGAPPFARETIAATFLAIEKGELVPPFRGHGIGTGALDAFFARALSRDPAERFPSLAELVNAFCDAAAVPTVQTLRSGMSASEQTHGATRLAAAVGSDGRSDVVTQADLPLHATAQTTTQDSPQSREASFARVSAVGVPGQETADETSASAAGPPRPPTTTAGTPVLLARPPTRPKGRLLTVVLLLGVMAALATWAVQQRSLARLAEPVSRAQHEPRVPWPVIDSRPQEPREAPREAEPPAIGAASLEVGTGGISGATMPDAVVPEAELPGAFVQPKQTKRPLTREPKRSQAPPPASSAKAGLKDRGF